MVRGSWFRVCGFEACNVGRQAHKRDMVHIYQPTRLQVLRDVAACGTDAIIEKTTEFDAKRMRNLAPLDLALA